MSELIFKCPFCGDKTSHHHLYVNQEKGVFYCQLCGAKGTIKYLVQKFPNLDFSLSRLFLPDKPGKEERKIDVSGFELLKVSEPRSYLHQVVYDYLIYRGLNDNLIRKYKVMVSFQLPKFAIFPVQSNPKLFWCARHADEKSSFRWLFPLKGTTHLNKSEAVWGLEFQKKKSEVWICEGIFDAAYVGGVAVFGKVPSKIQLRKILELHPSKVIVAFDNDAKTDAYKVKSVLESIVKVEVKLPPAGVKDFGELLLKTQSSINI